MAVKWIEFIQFPLYYYTDMSQHHKNRSSDHPYIDTVWRVGSLEDGVYHATPDGSWDLIYIIKPDGKRMLFFSGQDTRPVEVSYEKGEISLIISFMASIYLSNRPDNFTPLSINDETFNYEGYDFPLPSWENAEQLVDLFIERGLIQNDEIVEGVLGDKRRAASKRSVQMHFRKATGITKKDFDQIHRAKEAVKLLKDGHKPADVATTAGYTDQAHMIRSLKKIMGRLPSDVSDIHKL